MFKKYMPVTSQAAALRLVYGPNAAKKIARKFGIAVVTAKVWLSGRTPVARQHEIARALLDECVRLEALAAETRQRWGSLVNADETTADGNVVGRAVGASGETPDRVRSSRAA